VRTDFDCRVRVVYAVRCCVDGQQREERAPSGSFSAFPENRREENANIAALSLLPLHQAAQAPFAAARERLELQLILPA
jgi:hypothetical protein